MRVGMMVTFQNPGGELTDAETYRNELKLALSAEPLGLDGVFVVEHHFDG